MTSKEFTIWLNGFLDACDDLNEEGIKFIQDKLKEVQDDYIPSPGDWISPWNTTPIQPYVIDYNIVCPMGGTHDYPDIWHGITQPPCKKCGATLPEYTVMYDTSTYNPNSHCCLSAHPCISEVSPFGTIGQLNQKIKHSMSDEVNKPQASTGIGKIENYEKFIKDTVNVDPIPYQYSSGKWNSGVEEVMKKDIEAQFEKLRQANDINKDAPKLEEKANAAWDNLDDFFIEIQLPTEKFKSYLEGVKTTDKKYCIIRIPKEDIVKYKGDFNMSVKSISDYLRKAGVEESIIWGLEEHYLHHKYNPTEDLHKFVIDNPYGIDLSYKTKMQDSIQKAEEAMKRRRSEDFGNSKLYKSMIEDTRIKPIKPDLS